MLSSVTDLLRYVDENQLTTEFGGTLDYCHRDWIVLRTVSCWGAAIVILTSSALSLLHLARGSFSSPLQAIESFAVTVKDIAQMLQSFGTELAEAELPDEGKAIERLLQSHTEKYKKLKVRSCKGSWETCVESGGLACLRLSFLLNRMQSSRCQRRVVIYS